MLQLTSLGLHITNRCNVRCRHCAYGCGPDIKGAMTLAEARGYLAGQPVGNALVGKALGHCHNGGQEDRGITFDLGATSFWWW